MTGLNVLPTTKEIVLVRLSSDRTSERNRFIGAYNEFSSKEGVEISELYDPPADDDDSVPSDFLINISEALYLVDNYDPKFALCVQKNPQLFDEVVSNLKSLHIEHSVLFLNEPIETMFDLAWWPLHGTANPLYSNLAGTFQVDMARALITYGTDVFKASACENGAIEANWLHDRWDFQAWENYQDARGGFLGKLMVDVEEDEDPVVQPAYDLCIYYQALSLWRADGEILKPIEQWFKGNKEEVFNQFFNHISVCVWMNGYSGSMFVDFEDGNGEIHIFYEIAKKPKMTDLCN